MNDITVVKMIVNTMTSLRKQAHDAMEAGDLNTYANRFYDLAAVERCLIVENSNINYVKDVLDAIEAVRKDAEAAYAAENHLRFQLLMANISALERSLVGEARKLVEYLDKLKVA